MKQQILGLLYNKLCDLLENANPNFKQLEAMVKLYFQINAVEQSKCLENTYPKITGTKK